MEEAAFSFGPEHIQSPDIWSPTIGPQGQTVPTHLVPIDKWSPRTNSPGSFGPHGQMVPKTSGPPGQLVPKIY